MLEDPHVLGEPRRRPRRSLNDSLKGYTKFTIVGGTIFLLMSMGGAIYGAPALVPALWWVYRSSRTWLRVVTAFLAGLVMIEVSWALVYVTVGENAGVMIAAIATGFIGTIALFRATTGPGGGQRGRGRPTRTARHRFTP